MITMIGGDGREYGPVGIEQVRRWLAEGRATMETRVQRSGQTEWCRLGDLLEFSVQPPPLPPPPLPVAAAAYVESMQHSQEPEPSEDLVPPASRRARFAAMLLDASLSMLFALPGLALVTGEVLSNGLVIENIESLQLSPDTPGFSTLMVGMMIPASFQVFLLALRGQTVGKWLVRIRIVRADDESHAGFLKAVVLRSLVPGLIGGIPLVGPFFTLTDSLFIFRKDRRCLHDMIAGTKVISLDSGSDVS